VWLVGSAIGLAAAFTALVVSVRHPEASTVSLGELFVPMFAYGVVGSLIVLKRPQVALGWIFFSVWVVASVGFLATVTSYATAEELGALGGTEDLPMSFPPDAPGWFFPTLAFSAAYWPVLLALATVFTFLTFPDGLPSPAWRPVAWVTALSVTSLSVTGMLGNPLQIGFADSYIATPLPVTDGAIFDVIDLVSPAAAIAFAGCALLSLISVAVRWRHSSGVVRLQLRWFGAAVIGVAISFLLTIHNSSANVGFAFGVTLIPVACGMAILQYRLYDIDRIISRTLSYAIVTGLLVATFSAIVVSTSRLLNTDAPWVVAVATLASAALARPVLRRVQAMVDQRFDRAHYDAVRTVDAFGERLRAEVDVDEVQTLLMDTVQHSLQPATAQLRLVTGLGSGP
jgi:hypothetical protein